MSDIRQLDGEGGILLRQQDGGTFSLSRLMIAAHFGNQHGRQALRRLVHDEEGGTRHQRPRNGEHLLLAAAQFVAAVRAAFREAGKHRKHGSRSPFAAIARFSCTVNDEKMRRPCGTRQIPRS